MSEARFNILEKQIQIQKDKESFLGKGTYGHVYKAIYQNEVVALKNINNLSIFSKESKILGMIQKKNIPNVITYFGKVSSVAITGIVLEYLPGGSLGDYIYAKKEASLEINFKTAVCIIKQIAEGLDSLHEYKIIHGDIKSDNILLHSPCIKISDFGNARLLDAKNNKGDKLGTIAWKAPETYKEPYTPASDTFSFGMLVWEVLERKIPYELVKDADTPAEMEKNPLTFSGTYPKEAFEISDKLRQFKKEARITLPNFLSMWKEMEKKIEGEIIWPSIQNLQKT